jgi:hypothetical protein
MDVSLEEICVGHINPRIQDCSMCRIDEHNKDCPSYKTRVQIIKEWQPYLLFQEGTPTFQ